MNMRVLVTGGAGFIGAAATDQLRRAAFDARPGVRHAQAADVVACDLDRPRQVESALAGVDLVVHAAYGADAALDRHCATLLDAMRRAGVGRLIHLSSIAVYGDARGAVAEDAPLAPLDAYGAAKIACERRIAGWARDCGGAAVVARPGIVYGRGSAFWIDKLVARLRAGAWGTFGAAGEGVAALVHVDDVAALIVRAATRLAQSATRPGEVAVMNVVGPETPSWNAYFCALATAAQAGPLAELGPATVRRRQAGATLAKIWRKVGLPGFEGASLAPTHAEMALFSRKADYRTQAAARHTGWAAQVSLAEGLRRSL